MFEENNNKVLVVGSAPDATQIQQWDLTVFDAVVVINNAWQLTDHWHYHIYPEDFPEERHPKVLRPTQQSIIYKDYVPAQNRLGGFVYAGGTMAFTAAYWALVALKPQVMAFVGCDMVYPKNQQSHFYGEGTADPLRDDISLKNLEAKATRLQLLAAENQCLCVNLTSLQESRLVFPRLTMAQLQEVHDNQSGLRALMSCVNNDKMTQAKAKEQQLNYFIESGEYWKYAELFDPNEIAALDTLWLNSIINNRSSEVRNNGTAI